MKRISFDKRFVNKTGNDLIPEKIHTIRQNYRHWEKFENRFVELFFWDGKPYQKGSKHIVFAVRGIEKVERILKDTDGFTPGSPFSIYRRQNNAFTEKLPLSELAANDGLSEKEFIEWFAKYPDGYLALIYFSEYSRPE
jgi:hypothetical protein